MIKPIIKTIALVLLFFGGLILCWEVGVNYYLAGYIESKLIPKIAGSQGIDRADADITRIGLFETVVGPVSMGSVERSFLDISSIKIQYTLPGLINRRVKKITVSGVTANCAFEDNTLVLPGFNSENATPQPDTVEEPADQSPDFSLPVSIGVLVVNNALINLSINGDTVQLPLTVELTPETKEMKTIDGTLHMTPRGQEIVLTARVEIEQNRVNINLNAPMIRLENFADWYSRLSDLRLTGLASISAQAEMALTPGKLIFSAIDLDLTGGAISYQDIVLGPADGAIPVHIKLTESQATGWEMSLTGLGVFSPLPLRLTEFKTQVRTGPVPDEIAGTFELGIDQLEENRKSQVKAPVSLLSPIHIAGKVHGKYSDNGDWQLDISKNDKAASASTRWRLKTDDIHLACQPPDFRLSGEGSAEKGVGKVVLTLSGATIKIKNQDFSVDKIVFKATTAIDMLPDDNVLVDGDLKLSAASIRAARMQTEIKEAAVYLPVQWPLADEKFSNKTGNVMIGPLKWQHLDLGQIRGTLRQKGMAVYIGGKYDAGNLLPGLQGEFTGMFGMDAENAPDMEMRVLLQRNQSDLNIDLGRFAALADGMSANGDVAVSTAMSMKNGEVKGNLIARIDNGEFQMPESKISITGMQADLTMPDLFSMISGPGQIITFREAVFADIKTTDGKIAYQLEYGPMILIEQGSVKWCRGKVYTQPMRIHPDKEDYDLTLFCDRLNLADVLGQSGVVQADGEGTVSGRLPIRYLDGKISINDGFLYSAPGEGGIIHLSNTDALTDGLPETSPQYLQIDLVLEALKNYQYDWVKVLLNSEGEDLLIKLQFDGKPTKPLPFDYNEKKGGFVRVPEGKQVSEFKGLPLDLNLRIPLNQLIGYKDILNLKP